MTTAGVVTNAVANVAAGFGVVAVAAKVEVVAVVVKVGVEVALEAVLVVSVKAFREQEAVVK